MKFYGEIGYGNAVESAPGVHEDVIVAKQYYGDVIKSVRRLEPGESVNDNLVLANSISIVADAYLSEHFHAIRYVKWAGAYWTVTTVEVQAPRLILRLGGVYNGPKA